MRRVVTILNFEFNSSPSPRLQLFRSSLGQARNCLENSCPGRCCDVWFTFGYGRNKTETDIDLSEKSQGPVALSEAIPCHCLQCPSCHAPKETPYNLSRLSPPSSPFLPTELSIGKEEN